MQRTLQLLVYVIAWFAVVIGINSTSKAGSNYTRHWVKASSIHTCHRSSALQHFERGNAIKIHNRIMFDFYPGLPHIYAYNISMHLGVCTYLPSISVWLILFLTQSVLLPSVWLPSNLFLQCTVECKRMQKNICNIQCPLDSFFTGIVPPLPPSPPITGKLCY